MIAEERTAGTTGAHAAQQVAVVADSTADIPAERAAALGVAVVPLIVRFGERSYRDGGDITSARFLEELKTSSVSPSTSQPAVADFETVFRTATEAGRDVACFTIAAALSGTHNAARLAAEAVDPGGAHIRVVDTGTVSAHAGLAIVEAATVAAAGADLDAVVAVAQSHLARSRIYVVLDTLDYLQRGGRIGKAQALVGSLFSIKPILTVQDGTVVPLERVRTWRKALDRMVELARSNAPLSAIAFYHAGNPADADALADRLGDLVPPDRIFRGEIGPVVATYGGPGLVGIVPVSAE